MTARTVAVPVDDLALAVKMIGRRSRRGGVSTARTDLADRLTALIDTTMARDEAPTLAEVGAAWATRPGMERWVTIHGEQHYVDLGAALALAARPAPVTAAPNRAHPETW